MRVILQQCEKIQQYFNGQRQCHQQAAWRYFAKQKTFSPVITLQKEGQKTVTPSRCCSWTLRLLATLRFSSPSEPESSEGRLEAFKTRRSFWFILCSCLGKHLFLNSSLVFPSVVGRPTNQRHCRSGWSGSLLITLTLHTHQSNGPHTQPNLCALRNEY